MVASLSYICYFVLLASPFGGACSQVVELGGSRVLLVAVDDDVFAVSNKCSHLGLPIVGEPPC
jgi:nitrite reductase/ring-hydroxylating ferredoxin subunit